MSHVIILFFLNVCLAAILTKSNVFFCYVKDCAMSQNQRYLHYSWRDYSFNLYYTHHIAQKLFSPPFIDFFTD